MYHQQNSFGSFGAEYRKRHAARTPDSGVWTCNSAEAGRLVALNVGERRIDGRSDRKLQHISAYRVEHGIGDPVPDNASPSFPLHLWRAAHRPAGRKRRHRKVEAHRARRCATCDRSRARPTGLPWQLPGIDAIGFQQHQRALSWREIDIYSRGRLVRQPTQRRRTGTNRGDLEVRVDGQASVRERPRKFRRSLRRLPRRWHSPAAHRRSGDTGCIDLNVIRMLNSNLIGNSGLSHARPRRVTLQLLTLQPLMTIREPYSNGDQLQRRVE